MQGMYYLNLKIAHENTCIMKSKISQQKDGAQFFLSQRKKTLYRLDTLEGNQAVITSISSGRTYHKPKKTTCYVKDEGEVSNYPGDAL